MRTGVFLTARLGSSRLPRKHLLRAAGRTMIDVLSARILGAFSAEVSSGGSLVVIVTSDEPQNRDFDRAVPASVKVFYGSPNNIPLRHLQAARALDVDAIVAVDGDDILCSTAAMRIVRDELERGSAYVKTSGLPLGMNAFGYSRAFLEGSLAGNESKTLETGWGYIFDEARIVERPMQLGTAAPDNLRFTLDYPEDYEFFTAIVAHFGERIVNAADAEIVSYVVTEGLQRLTDPVSARYWDNFQAVRAREMQRG